MALITWRLATEEVSPPAPTRAMSECGVACGRWPHFMRMRRRRALWHAQWEIASHATGQQVLDRLCRAPSTDFFFISFCQASALVRITSAMALDVNVILRSL